MRFADNQNAILVRSFAPDEPIRQIDYQSELEKIEQDRHHREIDRLMRQRTGVCG